MAGLPGLLVSPKGSLHNGYIFCLLSVVVISLLGINSLVCFSDQLLRHSFSCRPEYMLNSSTHLREQS